MSLFIVPSHDDVDGDLFEAAKPLACLGWAAPAALTARVAIERGLLDLVDRFGVAAPERPSAGALADALYQRRRPMAPHLGRCTVVYGRLSRIAHGGDAKLLDAVAMIAEAEAFVTDWRDCSR